MSLEQQQADEQIFQEPKRATKEEDHRAKPLVKNFESKDPTSATDIAAEPVHHLGQKTTRPKT